MNVEDKTDDNVHYRTEFLILSEGRMENSRIKSTAIMATAMAS